MSARARLINLVQLWHNQWCTDYGGCRCNLTEWHEDLQVWASDLTITQADKLIEELCCERA